MRLIAEGTASVGLTANGKADIRQMFSSPSTFDISGSLRPSAAVEVTGEMGVDAHVAKTGLKITNTLHTSTLLDGVLQLKDGKIFDLDFRLPQDKMEIFNAEYVVFRKCCSAVFSILRSALLAMQTAVIVTADLSVCLSVTFRCFVQTIVRSPASGRIIILVSEEVKLIRIFAGGSPLGRR